MPACYIFLCRDDFCSQLWHSVPCSQPQPTQPWGICPMELVTCSCALDITSCVGTPVRLADKFPDMEKRSSCLFAGPSAMQTDGPSAGCAPGLDSSNLSALFPSSPLCKDPVYGSRSSCRCALDDSWLKIQGSPTPAHLSVQTPLLWSESIPAFILWMNRQPWPCWCWVSVC